MKLLLVTVFVCVVITGCVSNKADNYDAPYVAPLEIVENVYIMAITQYFKVNGFSLHENRKTKINIGKNILVFEGYVLLKIQKEPMIEVAPEKAAGMALATCITVLPLCPINLMLLNVAIGEIRQIEKKCFGNVEFYTRNDETYRVTLEETLKIVPKIKVFLESNNAAIAEEEIKCERINTTEKVGAQERT